MSLRALVVVLVALASSEVAAQPIPLTSQPANTLWQCDELGFAFRPRIEGGVWLRQYREPERWAVAWEVYNHLNQLGLPDPRSPLPRAGRDTQDRLWQLDGSGFAFREERQDDRTVRIDYYPYEREIADRIRLRLRQVDWQDAVRQGVRQGIERLVDRDFVTSEPSEGDLVRVSFRDAIVHSFNASAARSQSGALVSFRTLVEAGVEDAVIQAFEQADAATARAVLSKAEGP